MAASLMIGLSATSGQAQSEKAAEDPTKIVTKAGIAYSDEFSVSGSFALGQTFKLNGRVTESGQWSLGGSYLFPFAIVTVSVGRTRFDSGVEQTRLSIGGFVPLSAVGLKTGSWTLFVPFGYTYTKGRQVVDDIDLQDGVPIELSSNSGYVGLFSIKPINEKLTLLAGANVTVGTHDFSGVALGGGLSYHLTASDTVSVRASYIDNSFGSKAKVGVAYQHEF